ncbi:MAG: helix-turn-helix transcriptional regulator, partial [Gammaproteobacteria bacterium]|nr:helix-turn-helix transcriptional regulator [Gammaproteobacteria bacterium]
VFLNDVMGLYLSPEEVTALEARTEGWIAGLQMAALSMQAQEDVSGFIQTFTGSHRFIFDYLIEEVLNQQPPHIQIFLQKTSLLDRLTGPLCDAVTDGEGGQTILAQLEQANLFLVPLDDQRQWYRYHRLFADLLQQGLKQSYLEDMPALHRKACEWYQHNGLVREAICHALLGGDIEQAANLIEGHIFAAMEQRELLMLEQWLAGLPKELVRFRPWLSVAYAWVLAENKEYADVARHLQHADQSLKSLKPVEKQHIRSYIASIQAKCRVIAGDMEGAIAYA